MMEPRKSLKQLTLLDRFLFAQAMENPENMKDVLDIILGKDIRLKEHPQTEKEQRTSPENRFVKLDVWAKDEEENIYDTEVQKKDTKNLPKRTRYYQALIDSGLLEPGVTDFNVLNPVYIIIIAPFDIFGQDRYRYTFQMRCDEDPGLCMDDGAVHIFLNTHGMNDDEISPELKELLDYMEHTNDEKPIMSDKVKRLQESVRSIQENVEVGVRYMQEWEERALEIQEAVKEAEEKLKENEEKLKENEEKLKENEAKLKENEAKLKEEAAKLTEEEERKLKILAKLLERGMSKEEISEIMDIDEQTFEKLVQDLKACDK